VLAGLADAENHAAHADTIGGLVSGRLVATWAVSEPGRPFDPQHPTLTATATADGYRLDGAKDRVEAGPQSDLLLVTALAQHHRAIAAAQAGDARLVTVPARTRLWHARQPPWTTTLAQQHFW
jgi:alkylation response protein AidB-like acyl-CoA dehydrogenase